MPVDLVCIDEWRGRRVAHSVGLKVTGSLGILGRMRHMELIESVEVPLEQAVHSGVRYHPELLERFLQAMR